MLDDEVARRVSVYSWLAERGYQINVSYTFKKRPCFARIWQEVNEQRAYGNTLVNAVEAAARKAGWKDC